MMVTSAVRSTGLGAKIGVMVAAGKIMNFQKLANPRVRIRPLLMAQANPKRRLIASERGSGLVRSTVEILAKKSAGIRTH